MKYEIFVNNPWGVNTVLLYDETGEAVIIDSGCINKTEENKIKNFINENNLNLVASLNTHLHLDHIFGNKFIYEEYGLLTRASKDDEFLLAGMVEHAANYGLKGLSEPPAIGKYLKDGHIVQFGKTELQVIGVRGHSPGGLCYYCDNDKLLVAGDVLFSGSIGRADLPGGNYDLLIDDISTKLLVLDEAITVIPGHGPLTNIGIERRTNPFFVGMFE